MYNTTHRDERMRNVRIQETNAYTAESSQARGEVAKLVVTLMSLANRIKLQTKTQIHSQPPNQPRRHTTAQKIAPSTQNTGGKHTQNPSRATIQHAATI